MLNTHCMSGKIPEELQSSKVKSEIRMLEEIVRELLYSLGVGNTFSTMVSVPVIRAVKQLFKS